MTSNANDVNVLDVKGAFDFVNLYAYNQNPTNDEVIDVCLYVQDLNLYLVEANGENGAYQVIEVTNDEEAEAMFIQYFNTYFTNSSLAARTKVFIDEVTSLLDELEVYEAGDITYTDGYDFHYSITSNGEGNLGISYEIVTPSEEKEKYVRSFDKYYVSHCKQEFKDKTHNEVYEMSVSLENPQLIYPNLSNYVIVNN